MEIWDKSWLYGLLRHYVDWSIRSCFHSLKVEGKENLPLDGIYILAPNHSNALMDALVVLQSNKGATAFGARADIFRKRSVAQILSFLKLVPMARFRDGLDQVRNNNSVFDKVVECLERGIPFCIFVEGMHHASYEMQPAKGGIFAIAQKALEKLDKPLYIVPMGISWSDFLRPGADCTLRIGKALPAQEYLALQDKRERSRLLTEQIQQLVVKPSKTECSIGKKILAFPALLLSLCFCWPIELTALAINSKIKDKVWSNTVRFGCRLVILPLLLIIAAAVSFSTLHWAAAIALCLCTLFAPSLYSKLIHLFL